MALESDGDGNVLGISDPKYVLDQNHGVDSAKIFGGGGDEQGENGSGPSNATCNN